jgi:HK97 family phage major capsid protein
MAAPTATVNKAHAFVPFSIEVQEDWGALESEMGRLFQDAKDDLEGVQFVTGVGTTVFPQGFVVGTTATVAAVSGLTVTAANLYALEAALPPRFRPNESFVANRGIYNVIRGIDTAGGAALWLYVSQGLVTQAPTPGNTGATLLGRGAWEASGMQATVVNATKIMIVGDLSYFLILDRIGMQVELIPFLFGAAQGNLPTGQRGLYAYWRNTSKVLSAAAFVALTGTT